MTTLATGIFQGDLILRSAIILALKELRENPDLIRDCFASLPQDDITAPKYGEKTVEECVTYFTSTKINVKLGLSLTNLITPCVAIVLNGGEETEATIGDVNYEPSEPSPYTANQARSLASVHTSESYNITTIVQGEPELLLFLHSLVLFGLLRHKSDLLDARGFSRVRWSVGPAEALPEVQGREQLFARTIRLSGFARYCWPTPIEGSLIGEVVPGLLVASPVHDSTNTASSEPVTPIEPPPAGSNPFDPEDWADRDIISGQKVI